MVSHSSFVVVLVTMMLLLGCKKDAAEHLSVAIHEAAPNDGLPRLVGSNAPQVLDQLAKWLPRGIDYVAIADVVNFRKLLESGVSLLPVPKNLETMREQLSNTYIRLMGVDLEKADTVAVFGNFDGSSFGFAVTGKLGPLPSKAKAIGDLQMLGLGGILFFADADGLKALVKVAKRKKRSFASSKSFKNHRAALAKVSLGEEVHVAVSVDLSKLSRKMQRNFSLHKSKVEHGTVAVLSSGLITLGMKGDRQSLADLQGQLIKAVLQAKKSLAELRLKSQKSDNVGRIVSSIYAAQYAEALLDSIRFSHADGWLSVETNITLPSAWMLGMGAAVLAPVYMTSLNRAKTTEAIDELDKMYKSSSYYYSSPRVARGTGMKLPCQFPASQGMTPDVSNLNCCGGKNDLDKDDRCDVDTSQWTSDTWSALNFQMNDQHYFAYAYSSSGTGAKAKFTAYAYADLDCDGILSTFMRTGRGSGGDGYGCSMYGSSEFKKFKETE